MQHKARTSELWPVKVFVQVPLSRSHERIGENNWYSWPRQQPNRGSVRKNYEMYGLQAAWQSNLLQAVFERTAKCRALQAAWQSNLFQSLIGITAKRQVLQTAW
jgi:hypothetical protein